MALCLHTLVYLVLFLSSRCQAGIYGYEDPDLNLVNNWDFEDDLTSSDWVMRSAVGTKVNDSYTGSSALLVTNRWYMTAGPFQKIYGLKKNTNYYWSTYIKLVNNLTESNALPYVQIRGSVRRLIPPATTAIGLTGVSRLPYDLADGTFKQMGGDFKTANDDFSYYEMYFRVYNADVDYIVDTVSLVEITPKPDWKSDADALIEKHRKSPVTIVGKLPSDCDQGNTTISVTLTRHEFGFGTAITASSFVNTPKYLNFTLDNFNWAVTENDMKWKKMEKKSGAVNYGDIDEALTILRDHDFTLRGHTLFWGVKWSNPQWLHSLYGANMTAAMESRADYMINHFNGTIDQWDLANEHQQERFYEVQTGDLTIMEKMFTRVRSLDPTAKLYFNDYVLLRGGLAISSQLNMVKDYQSRGIPVDGIAVQGHMKELPVDPEMIQKRLDLLSMAGLPIVISELSLHSTNVTERRVALDTILRIAFSNPLVEAVVFWGFSDLFIGFADDSYLTNGADMEPNEAGAHLLHLIHEEWSTSEDFDVECGIFHRKLSAFHGKYKLTVTTNGQVVHQQDFLVSEGCNIVYVDQ